jgi:hypothetical protein
LLSSWKNVRKENGRVLEAHLNYETSKTKPAIPKR